MTKKQTRQNPQKNKKPPDQEDSKTPKQPSIIDLLKRQKTDSVTPGLPVSEALMQTNLFQNGDY